ncbi:MULTISPECIES: DUF6299 family protein [unclassified Nocardia]|uniref:DUF6299 family protein n=1 Tax=unclassified Nocardia TaxID=2637762 RepID=UPI001CE4A45A|nr:MULTISPECIES: DUF6299 family protein [unclassified Nocardia]
MVEYLRPAERRTLISRNRIIELVAATTVGFAGTAVLAGPTLAAPSASVTVDQIQHIEANSDLVDVTGTYTCSSDLTDSYWSTTLEQGLARSSTSVLFQSVTCDGAAHPYTSLVSPSPFGPVRPGPGLVSISWRFYGANGATDVIVHDTPVTVQR